MRRFHVALTCVLFLCASFPRRAISLRASDFDTTAPFTPAMRRGARATVLEMFHHGYDNYVEHAFPHDELRPMTATHTDSLGELGNLNKEHLSETYEGVALTLIDATSTLAVLGNATEFAKNVRWLSKNLDFDVDVRVNAFECNIRVLGGLLSAHALAHGDADDRVGPSMGAGFVPGYDGALLPIALDLGERLLRAFDTATGMPYAWVNLRHGVRPGETTETNVAAVGSFTLEFGVLSRLTGDARFETAAKRAVRALWSMRDPGLDLLGNTLDVRRGTWTSRSGGIGAGCDSFFEYLLKAHVVLGDAEYLDIFNDAYVAAMRHYHDDGWYHEANLHTGAPTHLQATSLQAFWPGMQTLFGDVEAANRTHARFASVWRRFGMFPERFMYRENKVHASEKYYPLRPEFAESSAMLWFATRDDRFRHAGRRIAEDINKHTRAPHGHASVRDVQRKKLEDHQPSFFLAETCKYLYLLFDETFLEKRNVAFSTEGHPLPIFLARDDARVAENDHGEAGPSEKPYTSLEFVEMVRGVAAEAYDRRRRRRNLAGTSRGPVVPALGGKWDAAVASLRVAARWPDPSAALHGSQHNGAGWGATERLCPNLAVVGTAVAGGVCSTVESDPGGGGADATGNKGSETLGWEAAAAEAAHNAAAAERLAALAAQVEALREAMMQEKAKLAEARRDEEADGESDSGSGSGSGSGSSAREKTPRAEKIRERRKEDVAARAGKGPPGKKARSAGQAPRPSKGGRSPAPAAKAGVRESAKTKLSECHVLDRREDHACSRDRDCGVDAATCAKRRCSIHGFCG